MGRVRREVFEAVLSIIKVVEEESKN